MRLIISLLLVTSTAYCDFITEQVALLQKWFPDAGITMKQPAPTIKLPDASAWMTEDEEVAWINSLGFTVTKADLQASYTKFVYKPVDPTTNVLWGTESDDLRNYYRLYKRTGYAPFLQQAQSWRDFMVNTYSNWQNGGTNVIEPEHVYLMGLIDWYLDFKDQATMDAINRILDFIMLKMSNTAFYEQRVSARAIQCLAYYLEKINQRLDVKPKLQAFVDGVKAAPALQGFKNVYYYVGENLTLTGQPAGTDLRVLFPKNVGITNDQGVLLVPTATTFTLKHFKCAASFQAIMLMHALGVAGRVLGDQTLKDLALAEAKAWQTVVGYPWFDKNGTTNNMVIAYNLNLNAPDLSMFMAPAGSSTPLYITQMAAFATDPVIRKQLGQQALLRQYGQSTKITSSEITGKKPAYFAWATWENGYFLTQK